MSMERQEQTKSMVTQLQEILDNMELCVARMEETKRIFDDLLKFLGISHENKKGTEEDTE